MKNLYIQTWLRIGNTKKLLTEIDITELDNYKQYKQSKTDLMLAGFQNNSTFKIIFK